MSATPEEFLGQGSYLAAPEPFSPSVFLDLPPTPGRLDGVGCGTEDDPAVSSPDSDDLVLPFISRMLMEEDIDDKFFYQFPDHPTLLDAQQPYAQILSDASAPTSSDSAAATTNTNNSSTLSPSSSSDAPASAAWPSYNDSVELSQLLGSPPYPDMGMGVGLDDFTAEEVNALLLPGQDEVAAGFQQTPAYLDTGGGGGRGGGGAAATLQSSVFVGDDGAVQEETTKADAAGTDAFLGGDGDHAALASAFFGAQNGENMDMLNMAFLKGMEEAKKFLPTNNSLLLTVREEDTSAAGQSLQTATESKAPTGFASAAQVMKKEEVVVEGMSLFNNRSSNGRVRRKNQQTLEDLEAETGRTTKIMMPEQEETGARELYSELMTCNYDAFVKRMDDLRIAMDSESEKNARKVGGKGAHGRQRANEVVDLRTMLTHCAQSVATGDRRSTSELLKQIKQHSSVRGDATQRLAYCFAEGLEARLAGSGSQVYRSLMSQRTSVVDYLKAYKLFMAASCFKKVKMHFSTMTMRSAVAGRSKLHVVEYGVQHGFLFPGLFHFLAQTEGGPPEVRLTAIAVPQPGFRPAHQIEETGRRLSCCAREFGVPFKFHGIAAKWETVRAKDLNIDPDEVLVINSEGFFGHAMDESVSDDGLSPRDMVLNNIREMRPNVFIQSVVNGTYGAPFFLTRFREALFFYSAQFDALDATIPRDNDERLLIERDMLGRSALNVIACEGADRVERPETYKQWQVRNHRAGLKQLQLNPEVVQGCRDKVKKLYHRDFLVDVDNRWLLLGWKGRVLYAMSTWVAEDNKPTF